MIKNTFFYGLSRLSRGVVYAVVAHRLGLSAEADFFLLTYAVALFFLTKATFLLGEVEVGRLEKADLRIVLVLIGGALGSFPLPIVSYILFGVLGSYLSGVLATRGKLLLGPLTSILASVVFLFLSFLSFDLLTPLLISEGLRSLLLLPLISYGKVPLSFLLSPLKYLPAFSLIGLVPLLARVYAGWLGEGNIALFSYSNAIFSYLISFLTAGIVVTLSYRQTSLIDGWKILSNSWLRLPILSIVLTGVSLLIYFTTKFSFLLILAFLFPSLLSYVLAHMAFGILSVARVYTWVFVSSVIYLFVFSGLSFAFMEVWGLVGIALSLTISSYALCGLLVLRVWGERNRLEWLAYGERQRTV